MLACHSVESGIVDTDAACGFDCVICVLIDDTFFYCTVLAVYCVGIDMSTCVRRSVDQQVRPYNVRVCVMVH